MACEEDTKERLWILVKAYPQPSKKYQETVCCAGITESGRLLRLYPIKYRHLENDQQFDRFDFLEVRIRKSNTERDKRPESYKIVQESIKILRKGKDFNSESKTELWLPHVYQSLGYLKEEQKSSGKSLGIIKPDENSLNFVAKPVEEESIETKELVQSAYSQASLLEKSLKPLERPEFVFYFNFKSAGNKHKMQIHDWEVQATYRNYKRKYGSQKEAITKMYEFYNDDLASLNPHFIMGNMLRSPWQFMIIGVLRTNSMPMTNSLFDFI